MDHTRARSQPLPLATMGLLMVVVPMVIAGGYLLPSPAALLLPAPAEALDSLIRVEGAAYQSQGRLYVTAVRPLQDPRLGQYLLARLQPDVVMLPRESLEVPGLSSEEQLQISQRLLRESCSIAEVVALRQANRDVRLPDAAVQVVRILPGSPAADVVRPGDVIESAGGERVQTSAELVSIVQEKLEGEGLTLRLRRGRRYETVTVPVTLGPLDADGPVLGLVVATSGFDFRAPVDIAVSPGPISGGTPGGLMYALGIYNALVTEDITRGRRIAGTGSLRLDGAVGPVAGVALKVRAAEDAGAEVFLAPLENEAAARAAAQDIKIIPVRTFRQALAAIRQLDSGGSNPRTVPASRDTTLAWYCP
ncbi:MAG: PDZ domain-containing protein [Anaerolineae bacterium]